MKNTITATLFLIFYALLYSSCASLTVTPAPWAVSSAAIRAVYPDSSFLAQRGRGKSRQAAAADAAAALARFFQSEIQANFSERTTYREINGRAEEQTEITEEMFVQSQIALFGIRYAQDAFYDKSEKQWQTVAYINRDEAWTVYEPRFKHQADSFVNLFNAAENETDKFKKALRYEVARQYTRTSDFESAATLGQILYPAKMNAEFAAVRSKLASLPQKIDGAKRNASVFIDCPVDFESRIQKVFADNFAALGFPVTRTKTDAAAICAVTVSEGEQIRDAGTFYYPSLQAVLSGASGALWTFNAESEKAAALTPDVAKRRAYTALSQAVQTTFVSQFTASNFE